MKKSKKTKHRDYGRKTIDLNPKLSIYFKLVNENVIYS